MRFLAVVALSLSTFVVSVPLVSQNTADRCAAAKALLEDRAGLAQAEVDYFTEIVESEECGGTRRAPATAEVQRPVASPVEPVKPELVLPTGPFSAAKCRSSLSELTSLPQAARGSDREKIAMHIVSSDECRSLRAQRARQLSADPGIATMMQTLKEGGIDVEARMPAQVERCRERVDRRIASGVSGNRQQMIEGCVAVARQMVYSSAINELNDRVNARYEQEMIEHRAELARLEAERQEKKRKEAAEKAAYEKSMAEWRRKVRLCEEGKREYCHHE